MDLLLNSAGLLGAKYTKLVGRDDQQGYLVVQVSLSLLNQNYVFGFQSWTPSRQGVGSGICAFAISLIQFLCNCPFL